MTLCFACQSVRLLELFGRRRMQRASRSVKANCCRSAVRESSVSMILRPVLFAGGPRSRGISSMCGESRGYAGGSRGSRRKPHWYH
jgi:hypothetical protein